MGEPIGHLTRMPFGFEARCSEPDCSWKISGSNRTKVERSLRSHADLSHPAPIPIYRTEADREATDG